MIACSRCIDGNLNVLATALHIPDEEVKTIKSKFKTAQTSYQAFHLLKKWQSFGTHTKQELAEVLQGAGFPQAKEMYVACQTLVPYSLEIPPPFLLVRFSYKYGGGGGGGGGAYN